MDPEESRVAEIWTGERVGSGYLVSGRHVLTARHVLEGRSRAQSIESCELRCLGQRHWSRSRVRWRDEGLDLAILEITDPAWNEPELAPVRWGWILGARAVSCTAVGFPDAQKRTHEAQSIRDTEQLHGQIDPLSLFKAGQLGISLARGIPVERGLRETWWSGMSGAAVFADGSLVGIVASVPQQFGGRRLNAVAVSMALRRHGFAAVLAEAGLDLHLEPLPSVRGLSYPWHLMSRRGLRSPSVLLRADRAVVPFRGRRRELEEMLSWCRGDSAPVRLLVGAGGNGKTRLALELCHRLDEEEWTTGILEDKAADTAISELMELGRPSLVVLDYAETRSNLAQLLAPLKRSARNGAPIRTLLLARSAGDWWRQLQGDSSSLELVVDEEPHSLGPVDDRVIDRQDAFREAVDAFAAAQDMETREVISPNLAATEYEAILNLHMAALDAVGTPEAPGPGSASKAHIPAVMAMLRREAVYWKSSAEARGLNVSGRVLARVVLLATLIGAEGEQETKAMLRRLSELRDQSEIELQELAWWHHFLYPGVRWAASLQPDLLAEELTAEILKESPELADELLRGLKSGRTRALTVLDRMVQRKQGNEYQLARVLRSDLVNLARAAIRVATQTGDPIGRLLTEAIKSQPDATEAMVSLEGEIPTPTLVLADLAALLADKRVEVARRDGPPAELARALLRQRRRLLTREAAEYHVSITREAVGIFRDLVRSSPEFRAELAGALNDMALASSSPGEAIGSAMEALSIYRELAKSRPQIRRQVAASLRNLAMLDIDNAPRYTEQALEILRELVSSLGDDWESDNAEGLRFELARSLFVRARALTKTEDETEALQTIREAVQIFSRLADIWPDTYRLYVAMALFDLSGWLLHLRHLIEAFETIGIALDAFRQLTNSPPRTIEMVSGLLTQDASRTIRAAFNLDPVAISPLVTQFLEICHRLANTLPHDAALNAAIADAERMQTHEAEATLPEQRQADWKPRDPCWCGSGRQYRRCHGR